MESILGSVSRVENSLILVEKLIQNIFIYELPEGKMIVNLKFDTSKDPDSTLIGGLTATIQEFAPDEDISGMKSISLEQLNLIFVAHHQFLIVFGVDASYPDEQFREVIEAFVDSFQGCLSNQEYGATVDGAAVAVQTIHNLISEEIHMDMQLGPTVTIYPFKLRELADATAQKVLGMIKQSQTDLYDDTDTQEADRTDVSPILNPREALYQLLEEFLSTFGDVKEITLIKTSVEGEFEQFTRTKLDTTLSDEVYSIVMGLIDTVSHLLDQSIEDRTVDVEEQIILFEKVSDFAFLYLVIDPSASIDNIDPIVTRIAKSILNLFPEELNE